MSTSRKLGVFLCLLGFFTVCALAIVSRLDGPFAGLQGIQNDLADAGFAVVDNDAPGVAVTADGRNLRIELPDVVLPSFDRDEVTRRLKDIDGVRNVELIGDPAFAVGPEDAPAPVPTVESAPVPTEESAPEPTTEPATEPTAAATVEPTTEPATEPTAAATAEPTAEPEPEPTVAPAPGLAQVVLSIDLSRVEFEPGTAELTSADLAILDNAVVQLEGQTGGPIQVQAHTDNVGDPDVNLLLSQDRAEAVTTYLTSRGVDSALLTPRGYGASQPIADNSTEQGRTTNRRVVFVVEGN